LALRFSIYCMTPSMRWRNCCYRWSTRYHFREVSVSDLQRRLAVLNLHVLPPYNTIDDPTIESESAPSPSSHALIEERLVAMDHPDTGSRLGFGVVPAEGLLSAKLIAAQRSPICARPKRRSCRLKKSAFKVSAESRGCNGRRSGKKTRG